MSITATMTKVEKRQYDRYTVNKNKSILFFHPKDETVYQNFVEGGRYKRPTAELKKHVADILTAAGVQAFSTPRWSQKAYCSCGCSPGFVFNAVGAQVLIWAEYEIAEGGSNAL